MFSVFRFRSERSSSSGESHSLVKKSGVVKLANKLHGYVFALSVEKLIINKRNDRTLVHRVFKIFHRQIQKRADEETLYKFLQNKIL